MSRKQSEQRANKDKKIEKHSASFSERVPPSLTPESMMSTFKALQEEMWVRKWEGKSMSQQDK
jgi:hypothetical protein